MDRPPMRYSVFHFIVTTTHLAEMQVLLNETNFLSRVSSHELIYKAGISGNLIVAPQSFPLNGQGCAVKAKESGDFEKMIYRNLFFGSTCTSFPRFAPKGSTDRAYSLSNKIILLARTERLQANRWYAIQREKTNAWSGAVGKNGIALRPL